VRRRAKRRLWGMELEEELGLSYIGERYDIFEMLFGHLGSAQRQAIANYIGEQGMDTLAPSFVALVPELAWSYRRADDRLLPRDGELLRLELRGAAEGLGSNLSFLQTRLRSVMIRPMRDRDRLILRGDFAYTDAETRDSGLGTTFNQIPEYYEFRTGGDRSVRGYAYESLLPATSITGGKHLLVGSLEYEYALFGDWSLAAFYDAGDAFDDYGELNLRQGTGIGARWRSPVGLVRLDLAVPLEDTGDSFRVHLTIGPEF
jgi:translocation and assembly module TamA